MTMFETLYAYDMYGKKKICKYAFRVENDDKFYLDVETAVNCSEFKKKIKQLKVKTKEKGEQKFWDEISKKKQQGYTNNLDNITSLKSNKHVIVYQNELKKMSSQQYLASESNDDVLFRMKKGSIPVLIYLESENVVVIKVNNVRIKNLHINNEMKKIFEYSKAFKDLIFEGFLESETNNLEKTAMLARKLCSIQNSLKLKLYKITIPDQTDMDEKRKIQFLQVIYDFANPNSSMIEIANVATQIDNSCNYVTNNSIIIEST